MPCLDEIGNVQCSEEKLSYEVCRGVAICENAKMEQNYCTAFHDCPYITDTYMCGPVHLENLHNECRLRSNGGSSSRFDCLNRVDEMTQLFRRTVFKPLRSLSPNLNVLLNYDMDYLYCRDNVTLRWNSSSELGNVPDLTLLNSRFGNIKYCDLKNGEGISDYQLYHLLMKDLGFLGRKYLPEGWLNSNYQLVKEYYIEYINNFVSF